MKSIARIFLIVAAGILICRGMAGAQTGQTPPVIVAKTPATNPVVYYQTGVTFGINTADVAHVGSAYYAYQWQFNGTNISGANASFYKVIAGEGTAGTYSVLVRNAAGSANAAWDMSINYGTLAYHLATNAAGRAKGRTGSYDDMRPLSGWGYAVYSGTNLARLTNAVWSTNFWLSGVKGLSATVIGGSNGMGAQGLTTMVSPRHYLFSTHMHPEGFLGAYLGTNNVIYWRKTLERVDVGNDTSVGILDKDLPPEVGFLPVVPTNLLDYLPTDHNSVVQGLGMNQDMKIFSQPMNFGTKSFITWDSKNAVPFGLGTNWNVAMRGGDSSNPDMLLIHNQLVLVTHIYGLSIGPDYASQISAINEKMHYLSIHNKVRTDYQLTVYPLTNWPVIH